jgi:hypothetical protein
MEAMTSTNIIGKDEVTGSNPVSSFAKRPVFVEKQGVFSFYSIFPFLPVSKGLSKGLRQPKK